MERVAFLVEGSGERIDCLLNPESLEVTRLAGIRPRGAPTGRVTGAGLADDPLHLTGGGRTELALDLLFDTELAPSPGAVADVRAHTRRLWQLAENTDGENTHRNGGGGGPPRARFVWGKTWNVPGIVSAIAERFDRFDADGTPRRSWLRMRFLRVADSATEAEADHEAMIAEAELAMQTDRLDDARSAPPHEDDRRSVMAIGTGGSGGGAGVVRFDLLASGGLGNPMLWRRLAAHNGIDDPLHVPSGTPLSVPRSAGGGGR